MDAMATSKKHRRLGARDSQDMRGLVAEHSQVIRVSREDQVAFFEAMNKFFSPNEALIRAFQTADRLVVRK